MKFDRSPLNFTGCLQEEYTNTGKSFEPRLRLMIIMMKVMLRMMIFMMRIGLWM